MREEDLFKGYSANARHDRPWDLMEEINPIEFLGDRRKCEEGVCPVMIATWTGRRICRYHERKRRESELSTDTERGG